MVAVELAHDPDHPIDRLEVHARHGAVGDEQRFVEPADLDRDKLRGRRRHAAGEDLPNQSAHPLLPDPDVLRDLDDRQAPVEVIDDHLLPLEFRRSRGARVRRRRGRRDGRGSFEARGHCGVLIRIKRNIERICLDGKKMLLFSGAHPTRPFAVFARTPKGDAAIQGPMPLTAERGGASAQPHESPRPSLSGSPRRFAPREDGWRPLGYCRRP